MKRLTKGQMWIFAIGQLGWSILSGVINTWLVTFYLPTQDDITNGAVQYLKPGLIIFGVLTILGLLSFVCRIFDAVTDPLIASLSDRSKNKRGRRIPFMQYAAIPFAVISVLVFCAPVEEISGWNIVWILSFLILFYFFMTMYCTPYNALISEFGKTQEDRMYISTAISLTFFFGTLLAYTPFVFAGALRDSLGFGWSYRVCFIVLAVIALVCMLLPTFLLKEKDFVDAKPDETDTFKSLIATFKNKDFRVFVGSDIMYWVGLTLFQTGLPFFVKILMHDEDGSTTLYYMGAMTVLSACFYPIVSKLVAKFGKKKLVITGFIGLAVAYLLAALTGLGFNVQFGEFDLFGVLIVIVAAFPMSLLGIIPQSIVADVAEEEAIVTGQKREGMFFAARTFAMKFGQSLAMLLFTSLAIIGTTQSTSSNDIVPSEIGCRVVAIVAIVFCLVGAVILFFYNEKKVNKTLNDNRELLEKLDKEEKEALGQE
ncbi:MAG: MFS transporter [Gammaproteobacteria bacterium]|nr:MFS transporter [Gammaproteobacteria bacterium]